MANGFKTGGREKGTPNQITQEIRDRITTILDNNFSQESIERDLKDLEPEKRLNIWLKLLEFTIPKLQATKLENESFLGTVDIKPKEWV